MGSQVKRYDTVRWARMAEQHEVSFGEVQRRLLRDVRDHRRTASSSGARLAIKAAVVLVVLAAPVAGLVAVLLGSVFANARLGLGLDETRVIVGTAFALTIVFSVGGTALELRRGPGRWRSALQLTLFPLPWTVATLVVAAVSGFDLRWAAPIGWIALLAIAGSVVAAVLLGRGERSEAQEEARGTLAADALRADEAAELPAVRDRVVGILLERGLLSDVDASRASGVRVGELHTLDGAAR